MGGHIQTGLAACFPSTVDRDISEARAHAATETIAEAHAAWRGRSGIPHVSRAGGVDRIAQR
jgi:hypothetical protein